MKIVYFVDHLRPDGTQRALQQLITGLGERGHEQTVVCLNDSWDELVVSSLRTAQAAVRIIGKATLASGYGFLRLYRWIRREHFDVAVTMLFGADVIGRFLAKTAGIPRIVSSLRARNVDYARWQRWLVRRTMPWADAVVLNSSHVRDFAIAQEGAPPDRIYVIPNAVKVEDYLQPMSRAALRAEFGLPADRCLIGSVGRLAHQKGFDLLLQAVALLPEQDVHLLLVGTGAEEKRLQAQGTVLGLGHRVHFAGFRRDVPRLLGALDLYVQPARFEGMPNALLEAMAAGCPIVASAVDGIQELIEDGIHGWLVPSEHSTALAEAIRTALSRSSEARQRGVAARAYAKDEFGAGTMVALWEKLLEATTLC